MDIDTYLSEKMQQRFFSGYQYWVKTQTEISSGFAGHILPSPDSELITNTSLFDLASLTKLFTATLAAVLHDKNLLDLDDPISAWSSPPAQLAELSAQELLTHISGLPAEWKESGSREKTIASLLSLFPSENQRGKMLYSCTGYSLFSVMLEKSLGKPFDLLLEEFLLKPLGISGIVFNPNAKGLSAVSTEAGTPVGVVHDPRAKAMDGVSGNAGLFACASDLGAFFSELTNPRSEIITNGVRELLFSPSVQGEWKQALGFRYQDRQRVGRAGELFSHTGFTGTLALIDPSIQTASVLLTNRLAGNTSKEQMAEVYKDFSEIVAEVKK